MTARLACWCGNTDLVAFCPGYVRCPVCDTLVSSEMPGPEIAHVRDETRDFYGREYWFSYQEEHLGNPPLSVRTRSDLPERCLHWLRTLLAYKLPPARALEVGSAHGGFVAMLRWAGFDATGLEISPWVVDFARTTFEVPILLGPLETQDLATASLDVIALMDVLEHLHDPAGTMRRCLDLLTPDGILLIQTPCYPGDASFEAIASQNPDFPKILEPREHLYLFSRRSIRDFFDRLGAPHLTFESALFPQYDMCAVVSRRPLDGRRLADQDQVLGASPGARMVQALLDKASELDLERQNHAGTEDDRSRRLLVIDEQGRRIGAVEAERNNLQAEVATRRQQMEALEADRAARLTVIEEQGRRLGEVEAERNNLQAEVATRRQQMEALEADRAARLTVIEEQGRRLGEVEAERNNLQAEVATRRQQMEALEADRAARLTVIEEQGRRLGELEAERNNLDAGLTTRREKLEALEADWAARLAVIEEQGRRLGAVEAEGSNLQAEIAAARHHIDTLQEQIQALLAHVRTLQTLVQTILRTRTTRVLRALGRWKFIAQAFDEVPAGKDCTGVEEKS